MKRLVPFALLLALGACATAYAPPPPFAETRIGADRLQVTFQAGGDPAFAADQALLRAAEITAAEGYDWFVVESRLTQTHDRLGGNGPYASVGGSRFNFGRFSGSSIGVGAGFKLGGTARPRVASTVQVRMGRGP